MKVSGKLLVDSGFFVAAITKNDQWHKKSLALLKEIDEQSQCFSVESCITEALFFLQQSGISHDKLFKLLSLLSMHILCLNSADLNRINELMTKYADLPMDFADAVLVASAERHNITTIVTLDRKDFAIYRPRHIDRFKVLPA